MNKIEKEIKPIKCKKCPYYTGVKCHGHGEYWGTCNAIEVIKKTLSIYTEEYTFDIELKKYESLWIEALNDDSECILFEIRKEKYDTDSKS